MRGSQVRILQAAPFPPFLTPAPESHENNPAGDGPERNRRHEGGDAEGRSRLELDQDANFNFLEKIFFCGYPSNVRFRG